MTDEVETRFNARIRMLEDGSLSNRRAEQCALLMADGLTQPQAWRLLGGTNSEGSLKYRKKVFGHPVYKLRIENLMTEKAELDQDQHFGDVRWMANQLWRQAVATNDTNLMKEAAKLRLEVGKQMSGQRDKDMPGTPPARPGAPVSENSQARQSAAAIREGLIMKGLQTAKVEDET